MLQLWPNRTLYRPSSRSVKEANDYCIINSICSKWIRGGNTVRCSKYYGSVNVSVFSTIDNLLPSMPDGDLWRRHNSMWTLFVLHMSSEHHFNCYRMCTLSCMQNCHYWHHTSPFLGVIHLQLTHKNLSIFIRVRVAILPTMRWFYI